MIMLVLKKCNGDWGSALPQFARNLAPTLTTTTATRLSVQTESRRCANPPWFNRSLGWWNWVPKCSGFLGGGVQRFCWTQQIYRSNKFLDPICFWMQALFRPNMFFWIRAIFWIQESFGTKAFKDLWIPTFQSGDIRKSSTLSLSTCRRCGQRRCRRCRQRRCRRCCRYVGQWPIIVVMWADGPE